MEGIKQSSKANTLRMMKVIARGCLVFATISIFFLLSACGDAPRQFSRHAKTDVPDLFFAATETRTTSLPRALSAVPESAIQAVQLNPDILALVPGQTVRLTVASLGDFVITLDKRVVHSNGDVSLIGFLADLGPSFRAIITSGLSGVFGRIQTPSGIVSVTSDGANSWLVDTQAAGLTPLSLINDALLPSASLSAAPSVSPLARSSSVNARTSHTTVIDVLVLYSAGLAARYPGATLQTRLNALVALTNTAYVDSQIDVQIRMAHSAQIDFSDTVPNSEALTGASNGVAPFDKVAALRAQYGADVVTFIRPFIARSSGSCGISWLNGGRSTSLTANSAFSVVAEGADGRAYCDDYTLAHELGHSMGSAHDLANSDSPGVKTYSYGYGTPAVFGTIMSYISPQAGKFSNPNINTCLGQVCGVVGQADNARSINEVRDVVAAFGAAPVDIPLPPTVVSAANKQTTVDSTILTAIVDPNGLATTVYFEYGLTAGYGLRSDTVSVPASAIDASVEASLQSLQCNQVYHYRVVAVNTQGVSQSADRTFSTSNCILALPEVITDAATTITADSAILRGQINPNAQALNYYFEYGVSTSYGTTTATRPMAASAPLTAVQIGASGLSCATTYHFRLVADASGTISEGNDQPFTTSACPTLPPLVITKPARTVSSFEAVLAGTVNTNGITGTAHFEYGLSTTSLPDSTPPVILVATGTPTPVSFSLSSLACETQYFFRATGDTANGSAKGDVLSFTTLACSQAPRVLLPAADVITQTSARVKSQVWPNGLVTKTHIEYGTTTSYGQLSAEKSLPAVQSMVNSLDNLTALSCNTTYHLKTVATNSQGTTASDDATFTTAVCVSTSLPVIDTTNSRNETQTTFEIVATVNPTGKATQVIVEYGESTLYGTLSIEKTLVAGAALQQVIIPLSGLVCNKTYHYRVLAQNSDGQVHSNDASASTLPCGNLPTVTTGNASNVATTSVVLGGVVNANSRAFDGFFEYGSSTSYGQQTAVKSFSASSADIAVSMSITGLQCGAVYHYRLAAMLGSLTVSGQDGTFTTLPCGNGVPINAFVVTDTPIQVKSQTAQLRGTVDPDGVGTTVFFEYGLNTSYGSTTPQFNIGGATLPYSFGWLVNGLSCDMTYHYRVVAIKDDGSAQGLVQYGQDISFISGGCPLAILEVSVDWVSLTSATISAWIKNDGAPTTVLIEFDSTKTFTKQSKPTVLSVGTAQLQLTDLVCDTKYDFQVVAKTSVNEKTSQSYAFTTRACSSPPEVQTLPATEITTTTASLLANATANTAATTLYFEYGETGFFGNQSESLVIVAGDAKKLIQESLTGLKCEQEYQYRIVASNDVGTVNGETLRFSTNNCSSVPGQLNNAEIQLVAGGDFNVAINKGGTLVTWGSNAFGQLAAGSSDPGIRKNVRDAKGSILSNVQKVAAGASHALALLDNGNVIAWGDNAAGQLGNGSVQSSVTPVIVQTVNGDPLGGVIDIAAGKSHSLALVAGGQVYAWGSNAFGQLGSDSLTESKVAVEVLSARQVKAISAGAFHNIALLDSGRLLAWGKNTKGQLGIGSTANASQAKPVGSLQGVTMIAAGGEFSLALTNGGNIYSWGDNTNGQLGLGNNEQASAPMPITFTGTGPRFKRIAAGARHALAITDTGAIMAWGDNENGQLALAKSARAPTAISGFGPTGTYKQVAQISAGDAHSVALVEGAKVVAWGSNASKQLGFFKDGDLVVPVVVRDQAQVPLQLNNIELLVSKQTLAIAEGEKERIAVHLSSPPENPVSVTVSFDGSDPDLTVVNGSLLIFDASNWQNEQQVTLQAVKDNDTKVGSAALSFKASGLSTVTVQVSEIESGSKLPSPNRGAFSKIELPLLAIFGLLFVATRHRRRKSCV